MAFLAFLAMGSSPHLQEPSTGEEQEILTLGKVPAVVSPSLAPLELDPDQGIPLERQLDILRMNITTE